MRPFHEGKSGISPGVASAVPGVWSGGPPSGALLGMFHLDETHLEFLEGRWMSLGSRKYLKSWGGFGLEMNYSKSVARRILLADPSCEML